MADTRCIIDVETTTRLSFLRFDFPVTRSVSKTHILGFFLFFIIRPNNIYICWDDDDVMLLCENMSSLFPV